MPNPHKGESEQDYISRFMASEEARRDFPDEKQRAAMAYSKFNERRNTRYDKGEETFTEKFNKGGRKGDEEMFMGRRVKLIEEDEMGGKRGWWVRFLENSRGQSGRLFPMRFIEPGLVRYNDVGDVLVTKEALDRMSASFVGKPIFNEQHRDVSSGDFKEGKADGVIGRVWYDASDGWFWADAIVWDDETVDNIKNGYSLSCAYDVPNEAWGPGGIHNNIPYDREVMNGEYTHLAIVPNPRYERARIIYNQGGRMKLKFWEKDKPAEQKEMELANANIIVGDKEMSVEKMIELANAETKRQEELENAKKIADDTIIEVGGRKMTIADAKALAVTAMKNASEADMKDAHKDGKHSDKEMDNCPMCNSDKEEKEKEEERKNAEAKEKDEKEKEMENQKNFDKLKNASKERNGEFKVPNVRSQADRVAEGSARYGAKN